MMVSTNLGLSLIAEAVTLWAVNAVKGLFKNPCHSIDLSGYPLGGRAFVQGDKRKSYNYNKLLARLYTICY